MTPPQKLIPWLSCEDSLTQKLKTTTGDASIQVLKHGLRSTCSIGIQENLEFMREIVMFSQKTCCWYARSLASLTTYEAYPDFFKRLQQNALYVMLFQEKLAVRQSLAYYAIRRHDREFDWVSPFLSSEVTNHSPDTFTLWGRCACFLIANKAPFYLFEIFLPQFLDLIV